MEAAISPRGKVFHIVDDPAAKLPIDGACAVGAMLFERAAGWSEIPPRLRYAQKPLHRKLSHDASLKRDRSCLGSAGDPPRYFITVATRFGFALKTM